MPSIRTKSSLIPVGGAEFVVTHMPTNDTLAQYVQDLQVRATVARWRRVLLRAL